MIVSRFKVPGAEELVPRMLDFLQWIREQKLQKFIISLRDILSWVDFINVMGSKLSLFDAYLHGACLVLLDSVGFGAGLNEKQRVDTRAHLFQHLLSQIPSSALEHIAIHGNDLAVRPVDPSLTSQGLFGLEPFTVPRGPFTYVLPIVFVCLTQHSAHAQPYSLETPTTAKNVMRVLRAMQLPKAILLEGSPGVGKTSLINAIGAAAGRRVVRINLSEQTDMMDLVGSDLPVEGAKGGQFAWRDGVFLQALKVCVVSLCKAG